MALSVHPLLGVPAPPRKLQVMRNIRLSLDLKPAEKYVPDPKFATPDAGRWATLDGTLYTASDVDVCWAEYCRLAAESMKPPDHAKKGFSRKLKEELSWRPLGPPPPARALVQLEFELRAVPDLTSKDVLSAVVAAGFDPNDMFADDHRGCQVLAALGEQVGWDAMIVPSAALPGEGYCVPIFKAGRTGCKRYRVHAAVASPTVSHALNTRYRAGTKPSWLRVRRFL